MGWRFDHDDLAQAGPGNGMMKKIKEPLRMPEQPKYSWLKVGTKINPELYRMVVLKESQNAEDRSIHPDLWHDDVEVGNDGTFLSVGDASLMHVQQKHPHPFPNNSKM